MGLIVQKFGGSSVANAERINNVAKIVTDTYKEGNQVVVVVSAQGDTTDDFIEKANEINNAPSKRELDVLLSAGEQISMSLLAMAIEKLGYPVTSLTGWQAGIETTSVNGDARIKKVNINRMQREIDRKRIVIVAGFQGLDKYNNITTLGRGGSDTTAVAIAAKISADLCQIYTDVDGVYTADPRIVSNAEKLEEITFNEMLELASLGAQVLHNRSVEMGKKYGVNMEVVSSFERKPGTKIKEATQMEQRNVSGVTSDNNTTRIAITGIPDQPGFAFRVFSAMSKGNISVDMILQSIGRNDTKDISFTVSRADGQKAMDILNEQKGAIKFEEIHMNDKISKVSIVGAGMVSNCGIATTMFEALFDSNINIHMISTTEIKISVLIDEDQSKLAVKAIHSKFFD
ncbi:MAG: aspartate kinase [Clostridia bacterium]